MGGRTISPGAALLRSSRVFSIPKTLPETQSNSNFMGERKSDTMTEHHPRHQAITSPISSREKGDWGLKRTFPFKTTMNTSTPSIRVKKHDSVESITDFASAADHALSLEKFQDMRIAMTLPRSNDKRPGGQSKSDMWAKSVFEDELDFTEPSRRHDNERRWKFQGPWLARLTEGEFAAYIEKKVQPRRLHFREVLRQKLIEDITNRQNTVAREAGEPLPPPVKKVSSVQFAEFLRSLRNDRSTLYSLVSKFLDLAPLGQPVGIVQTMWGGKENSGPQSPYGKSGPPPSHPSAGISYLRTNSYMENHPVYGPQARRTPAHARVVLPRVGPSPAKLGVGGFVADAPSGDNEFNFRHGKGRTPSNKSMLNGIMHLDTETYGGAKAYVEPQSASVDSSGKVVVQLRESSPEAVVVAKENRGRSKIYNDGTSSRYVPSPQPASKLEAQEMNPWRMERVTEEIMAEAVEPQAQETDVVGSSSSYGLEPPRKPSRDERR